MTNYNTNSCRKIGHVTWTLKPRLPTHLKSGEDHWHVCVSPWSCRCKQNHGWVSPPADGKTRLLNTKRTNYCHIPSNSDVREQHLSASIAAAPPCHNIITTWRAGLVGRSRPDTCSRRVLSLHVSDLAASLQQMNEGGPRVCTATGITYNGQTVARFKMRWAVVNTWTLFTTWWTGGGLCSILKHIHPHLNVSIPT